MKTKRKHESMVWALCGLICLVLFACNIFSGREKVRDFVPGTYIAGWSTEFSHAIDTIVIKPHAVNGSITLTFKRKTNPSYVKAVRKWPPSHTVRSWTEPINRSQKTLSLIPAEG